MCTDENETLEEICQKFRDAGFPDLADHIAAAAERERDDAMKTAMMAKCEVCSEQPLGNAAAMRKACANIAEYAKSAQCHTEDAHVLGYLRQMENWAQAALALPPRQCDVGTAEEQTERFEDFCEQEKSGCCGGCAFNKLSLSSCFSEWAQMPYEEQEGGGK